MNDLPNRALDLQLDLLRYYTQNEYGRKYADGTVETAYRGTDTKWR